MEARLMEARQRNCLERWLFFSKELGDFDYAAVGIDGA